MSNEVATKTSATSKGGTHKVTNNYSTSCTRSARTKHDGKEQKIEQALEGHPEKTLTMNTARIEIHPDYQRSLEDRKGQFNSVVREYDPDKARHLKVAMIGGHYYCYDGQLTMKATEKVFGGNVEMKCDVMYGLTLEEMGILFSHQDDNNRPVSKADKIRVSANSGDEKAILFRTLNEEYGFSTDRAAYRTAGLIQIKATTIIWTEFNRLNTAQYRLLLRVLRDSFSGEEYQTHNGIISGLSLFIRTYDGEFNPDVLVKALRRDGSAKIVKEARRDVTVSTKAPWRYAFPILESYNYRRATTRLPNKLS